MSDILNSLKLSLENIENDIKKEYRKKRRSSGRFENELEVVVSENGNVVKGQLLGSDYSYFVFHGRQKGKMPPFESIKRWVEQKGIVSENKNSLIFAIMKSISQKGTLENGIEMLNVLNKSVSDNFSQLQKTIFSDMNKKIKKELFEKSQYNKKVNV